MEEHTAELDGHLVFWREVEGDGTPILWVHGVPDSADLWLALQQRLGGIALDLPGFGRSGKRGDFPYSIDGYVAFLARFCDHVGLERFRLVCHDWGAVALALAAQRPERVERLVAIDVIPFLEGYRWHRVARGWRTPLVGELLMGLTTRITVQRAARMPKDWARSVMSHFDHGTQRAILRLYRSADPPALAAAGRKLTSVGAPALVLWGERDPYFPADLATALASRLPGASVHVEPGAGHWPWIGRPSVADRIVAFLTAETSA